MNAYIYHLGEFRVCGAEFVGHMPHLSFSLLWAVALCVVSADACLSVIKLIVIVSAPITRWFICTDGADFLHWLARLSDVDGSFPKVCHSAKLTDGVPIQPLSIPNQDVIRLRASEWRASVPCGVRRQTNRHWEPDVLELVLH